MTEFTATFADLGWEYYHFTYPLWKINRMWVTLTDDGRYTEPLARQFFWELVESEIATELQGWQNQGWELVEPASAHGLRLQCREYIDKQIDLVDIMLWIATLGMALLVNLFLGSPPRHYMAYEPLEFRVLIRRPVLSQ